MGVDAVIYVRGVVTPERFESAYAFLADRWPKNLQWLYKQETDPTFERTIDIDGTPIVEMSMGGHRYYGPGYERGHWPTIHEGIRLTQAAFPDHDVCYGGDSGRVDEVMTPEKLEALWQHYLGPNWNAYRLH